MFQKTLRQTTRQMGRNTSGIWIRAPLQYLLITVKVVPLEKVSLLVIHKILRCFVNTLTVDEKRYLLTRDNLTQTIEMQLSEKQKTFFNFFFCFFFAFLKSILHFNHLSKKDNRLS